MFYQRQPQLTWSAVHLFIALRCLPNLQNLSLTLSVNKSLEKYLASCLFSSFRCFVTNRRRAGTDCLFLLKYYIAEQHGVFQLKKDVLCKCKLDPIAVSQFGGRILRRPNWPWLNTVWSLGNFLFTSAPLPCLPLHHKAGLPSPSDLDSCVDRIVVVVLKGF